MLHQLHGTDRACSSHSVWFTNNHRLYLPLVNAMVRVIGMERQLGHRSGDKDDRLNLAYLRLTDRKVVECKYRSLRRRIGTGCHATHVRASNAVDRYHCDRVPRTCRMTRAIQTQTWRRTLPSTTMSQICCHAQ
jgi:hypothetical protein